MPYDLSNRLLLLGGYEALCEASMQLFRGDSDATFKSQGIRELVEGRAMEVVDEAGAVASLYVIEVDIGKSQVSMAEGLSKSFPTIVVGVSQIGAGFDDMAGDECSWATCSYIDGTRVLDGMSGNTPSLPAPLDDYRAEAKAYGYFPATRASALHACALERTAMDARPRLAEVARARVAQTPAAERFEGFPRWSLLTHAVNSQGLSGFSMALQAVAGDKPWAALLHREATAAAPANVAAWPDTLLFGTRSPSSTEDDLSRAPFSDPDRCHWERRWCGILEYIGQPHPQDRVAPALLRALADASVCLQDGSPAVYWLVGLTPSASDARRGISRLVDEVVEGDGAHSIDVAKLAQTIRRSDYAPDAIRLAHRLGKSVGYMASFLLPSGSYGDEHEQQRIGLKLIDAHIKLFGSIKDFPAELQRAFEDARPAVARIYEAKRLEQVMSATIDHWKTSGPASAAAAVVVTKKVARRVV